MKQNDSAAAAKKTESIHRDHRARMRARVEKYGLESLEEHEVLEYLLFFAIPRRDTNPLAHALIARFGSLAGVLEAEQRELCEVEGIGPSAAHFLHLLPAVERCHVQSRTRKCRKMETTLQIGEYLLPLLRGEKRERLVMLAFNDRKKLLRTIWLDAGTINAVDADIHRIAVEAVGSGASVIVLAHNHPGGNTLPSREDIVATGEIMRALGLLGIHVIDHIIIAGDEYLSMRESKRLPFYNFKTGELHYLG